MSNWIEWSGGKCPVAADVLVDCKRADGDEYSEYPAHTIYWYDTGDGGSIIAYRLSEPDLQSRTNDANLQQAFDTVQRPAHYNQSGIECIDAIAAAVKGKNDIEAVCVGNVIKYLWRYELKNGVEDVRKAQWYLDRLVKELSK